MIELPHYAGIPEDLIEQARPVTSPSGSRGYSDSPDGWPPLIWASETLHRAFKYTDYDTAVEIFLCALSVAPDDLRPMLLAGLKANHARVLRH
ncbi:hypothetical protein C6A85_74750, partial [Mycobacterium sp. ITM-2017-0098]